MKKQNLVVLLLRDWWTERNKVNAGEGRKSPEEVCRIISRHHLEFCPAAETGTKAARPLERWKLPPLGHVKVNFDASFVAELKAGAYGYVIRTDTGEFVQGAGKLSFLRSALHGEAEAEVCIVAMEPTAKPGIHRVQFESDCTTLVASITDSTLDLSENGVMMREAWSLRILHFDSAKFIFCRRDCNKLAHYLAQFGFQDAAVSSMWKDTAPDFVNVLLASDLAEQPV
uniref:Uncharacterized protein n=1 Tax=Avena sativa TaxID=4498 RepID=A0ACD6AMS5_AVESA